MKRLIKFRKLIALFILVAFFESYVLAIESLALTGHNSMPEYRSFEPVSTTNMVNLFDGSFTYNIPLIDIPNGYPITLCYHSSEINTEAQATWCGLGWTLNPGAINRIKRGFPDEFNGKKVTYHTRMPANWTATAKLGAGIELLGPELGLSLGASIRYNNYKGVGRELTGGVSLAGMASLNFTYSAGRFGFSPSINPGAIFQDALQDKTDNKSKNTNDQTTEDKNKEKEESKKPENKFKLEGGISYGAYGASTLRSQAITGSTFTTSFVEQPRTFPVSINKYDGLGLTMKFDLGAIILPLDIAPEGQLLGNFVWQDYEDKNDLDAYGYMNLEGAMDDEGQLNGKIMDYYTENEKSYEKRDRILGIPLPNNDIFVLTGEGMGGFFRAYRSEFGHYTKTNSHSETITAEIGADVKLPVPGPIDAVNLVFNIGGNIGGDYQEINVGNWDSEYIPQIAETENENENDRYTFVDETYFKAKSDEKFVLRYSGDLAGNFNQTGDNDCPVQAKLEAGPLNASIEIDSGPLDPNPPEECYERDQYKFDLDWDGDGRANGKMTRRNLRSSYIGMSFNKDFDLLSHNNIRYKVYERNLWIKDHQSDSWIDYNSSRTVNYGPDAIDAIGEIYSFNSDGVTYVYGLPIYTRNEKQLQFSLMKDEDYASNDLNEGLIVRNVSRNIDDNAKRKLGYESDTLYATQFLLTQVTSSDYLDKTFDGPTPDDFGSYTRFNYVRVAGGGATNNSNNWYKYRSPYDGLSFSYGSLSDNDDDMGSFVYGEKELYYLHSIVSKTHVAIFTLEDRDDGLTSGAQSSAVEHIINPLDVDPHDENIIRLKKLKRIDLYSIEDCEEVRESPAMSGIYKHKPNATPIKTVHFEYDYSLCNNIPNSIGSGSDKGKLTLKKVWFEYEGKQKSKISPYKFEYNYPNVDYPEPYDTFENHGRGLNQTPDYNVLNTDRWGNYRDYTGLKSKLGDLARFFPYTHQDPPLDFDPAAWCLKRIILPSGGEIHIQYEQDDYQYVHYIKYGNKEYQANMGRAMVMLPLLDVPMTSEGSDEKKYYVDLSKIGIDILEITPDEWLDDLVHDLFAPMIGNKEENRLYFNFLYSLVGDEVPDYKNINSEYIEGFARISAYGVDGNGVFFQFRKEGPPPRRTHIIDHGPEYNAREIPKKVCEDFYNFNRQGKITHDSNALDNVSDSDGESMLNTVISIAEQVTGLTEKCMHINPKMSYVRLRMPYIKAKKGGGIRVKRLMMYDSGQGTTELPSLFGHEYSYQTYDPELGVHISSGVATNEPSTGRRESPLVHPIDKESQSKFQAILYGRDIYGSEAPLGESLLPAPSVGYSRVEVRNIHKGKTSTGYEVHEFHTYKDFPFEVKATPINKRLDVPLGAGLGGRGNGVGIGASYSRVAPHVTQGYSFIMNNMHGKPKRIRKYAMGSVQPISEEIYEYYHYPSGSSVSVMDKDFNVSQIPIGKTSEMLAGMSQVDEMIVGGSFGLDLDCCGFVTPPWPWPWPIPAFLVPSTVGFRYSESILRSHVTTKIINYPAILKKVTRINDGVRNTTENLVFDKYTGNPVVVRTDDDFDNDYFNQEFKAGWKYPHMRAKAFNERMTAGSGKYGKKPYITFDDEGQAEKFIVGDLIKINKVSSCPDEINLYHVREVDTSNKRLYIGESALNTECLFLGEYGTFDSVDIIRSGYTNQMNTSMGNLVANHDGSVEQYVNSLSDETISNVISASANTFRDDWPYEENIYKLGTDTTNFELNPFEKGLRGRWRPNEQFTYRDAVSEGKNFESGKFGLSLFKWNDPPHIPHPEIERLECITENHPEEWVLTSCITDYSPNGEPIQDKNILNIYSTVKYGYNHTLPVLVAQNAEDETVLFESFEESFEQNNINFLPGLIPLPILPPSSLTPQLKHTGNRSLKTKANTRVPLGVIKITDKVKDEGIMVRLWLHATDNRSFIDDTVFLGFMTVRNKMTKISDAGKWSLFEGIVRSDQINSSSGLSSLGLVLVIQSSESDDIFGDIYVDDVRIQPLRSEMVCYVYDGAQRLTAVLDDQHFPMLYEYNAEGILIRKLKETIEGIKTISETQYSTRGVAR